MTPTIRVGLVLAIAIGLAGCFGPKDRRPGMRLPGEVAPVPSDWSFTNDHPEIAIEVSTPYFLSHSVTIVCVEIDGALYVGARDPESKRWPAWADDDPEVRLGIGDLVYEVALDPIEEDAQIALIRQAGATKYNQKYNPPAPGEGSPIRYWQVQPRS